MHSVRSICLEKEEYHDVVYSLIDQRLIADSELYGLIRPLFFQNRYYYS